MKRALFFFLWVSSWGALRAEPHFSGPRHFEGKVVKRASGQLDIFNGLYCVKIPKEKAGVLAPYLGKFVNVEYSMAEYGVWTLDPISGLTAIEETPENFPVVVTIEPIKNVFAVSEPIVARVTLENRSERVQQLSISMRISHTVLSQDYKKIFWLEPDKHYNAPTDSYRFEDESVIGELKPGARLVFTIESRHMAEPGKYDLSYVLNRGRIRNCVSEFAPIEVTAAADMDRSELLRLWIKKAALGQRIQIANELANAGDGWAIDEFLSQLRSGIYTEGGFFYREAYVFAYRHGGDSGERIMVDLIEHAEFQSSATDFIRLAFVSKNRQQLLARFLSCEHAMEMNLHNWVKHPRICDITANLLIQEALGEWPFPRKGSLADRNRAVTRVKSILKTNPEMFHSLRKK